MKLYLVRHGETIWNIENRYQGITDVPLSDKGEEQAREVRETLASVPFDAAYSSKMQRANRTAEIIAEGRDLKVTPLPDLHEMDLGEMEGVRSRDVHEKFPGVVAAWREDPVNYAVPGGESMQAVCDRTWPQLQKLAEKHKGENVLLVAHHTVNKALMCMLLPEITPKTRILRQGPCAINVLELNGDQQFIHSVGMNWSEGESSWHDLNETAKQALTNLKAVVFDLDGVLLDSMKHYAAAWRAALAEEGIFPPEIEFYRREGEKGDESIRHFFKEAGFELDDDKIESLRTRVRAHYQSYPAAEPYDGVFEIVSKIKAEGYKTAIVTGSTRQTLESRLTDQQKSLFDTIVTQDDYQCGKPDPEPYQVALSRLGIKADQTLVVENAPFGITSAKLAGCWVLAMANTLPANELLAADLVMKHLDRLGEWLAL